MPYIGPAKVAKRKGDVLNVWAEKDDTPKTFSEILSSLRKKAKHKENLFWKVKSGKRNLSRYLKEMVEKDGLLIRRGNWGRGKKGATYRPNRAGITTRELLENLGKIDNFCRSEGLYNFGTIACFDCDLFGVPPDKQLSPYEREVVRAIREKLADAWQLIYHLKYVLAARIASGHERRDVRTLAALYEHEFFNSLHNIFFFSEPDIRKWNSFLDDLSKQMASLSQKYGLTSPTTASFKRVIKSFPPVEDESFLDEDEISNLVFEKMVPDSENLALVVTQSFNQSEEFRGKIENWIYGWTRFIRFIRGRKTNQCNKFQELVNLIWWTERGLMQRCQRLKREEKDRLRHWPVLIERYGQENVTLFLDLVEELNQKELKLFGKHEFDSSAWINKKLEERLKAKRLFEVYTNEAFSN